MSEFITIYHVHHFQFAVHWVSIPYDTTTVNQTGNKSKSLDERKTFSNFTMLHYDASLLSSDNLLALKLDKYYVTTLISTKLHHTTYMSWRF